MIAKKFGLAMGLALTAALLFASNVSAHRTGSFHWHYEPDFYGVYHSCLYGPSGSLMYCN